MSILERPPTERELDEALASTFPASDPVALHFSDDPVPTRRMQVRESQSNAAVALAIVAAAGALGWMAFRTIKRWRAC